MAWGTKAHHRAIRLQVPGPRAFSDSRRGHWTRYHASTGIRASAIPHYIQRFIHRAPDLGLRRERFQPLGTGKQSGHAIGPLHPAKTRSAQELI